MSKLNAFVQQKGWIEVICGPMFAGKSEELLRKINRLKYAEVKSMIFKPLIDSRTKNEIKSRSGKYESAIIIKNPNDILKYVFNAKEKPQVVAIDEIQFFPNSLVDVCQKLANNGVIVYAAGLDTDFSGKPFPATANLLAVAEKVIKLTAICTVCGAPATKTQRLFKKNKNDKKRIVIGDEESYTARCRHHHEVR